MTTFLRNRWYMAAWAQDVTSKPCGKTILGEKITLYRTESGRASAVASMCPHKFAALYMGDVVGENIVCRYHGFHFGADGKCNYNPDGSSPPNMSVKTYEVVEDRGLIWVWIGDNQPDLSLIPPVMDYDKNLGLGGFFKGYLNPSCNYRLIMDNLLDHAHAPHLHEFFRSEALMKKPFGDITQGEEWVRHLAFSPDAPLSNLWRTMYPHNHNVDQWVDVTWQAPSVAFIYAGVTATGRPREEGVNTLTVHIVTPETEHSSHYYWIGFRSALLDDHEFTEKQRQAFQVLFQEDDVWIMEGQEEMMDGADFMDLKPVLLPQDKAAALSRRKLKQLLDAQAEKVIPVIKK